jgi:hypothetical protein
VRPKALVVTALVALAAGGALVACGASGVSSTQPGEAPQQTRARNEILMLDGKVMEWRREMGLPPEPSDGLLKRFLSRPNAPLAAPPAEVPEQCNDVCILADYICQAADDICRLARDLPEDDWAKGKCAKAKASCAEARHKCTQCAAR